MRIGVIGGGVVGHATARCFMEHAEVRVYDIVPEKSTHTREETLDSDLIFVCLPTPQEKSGLAANIDSITVFFFQETGSEKNFVLRSTVPIGTTAKLSKDCNIPNLIHSPEFLTARCAVTDAQLPSRNIIGIPNDSYYSQKASRVLHELYSKRFPGTANYFMASDESEAVKLFLNGFFAVKVAYFNEIYQLSRKLGIDWSPVLYGMLSDGRIAHSHTQVPGHDGYGFGGACLPKDLASLVEQLGEDGWVTGGALERNKLDRKR